LIFGDLQNKVRRSHCHLGNYFDGMPLIFDGTGFWKGGSGESPKRSFSNCVTMARADGTPEIRISIWLCRRNKFRCYETNHPYGILKETPFLTA